MPIPFDPATSEPPAPAPLDGPYAPQGWNPYQLPDPQRYAVDQERMRHIDALYHFGEYAMFVLMWTLRDFEHGLVTHCTRCWGAVGGQQERIADVYKQPKQERCPNCFGTTFEGGWKAKIIRPSLWDFTEDADGEGRRGKTIQAQAAVQSTHDFQMHTGDYLLRGDGTRWSVASMNSPHLRTGFEQPLSSRAIVAFNFGQCVREDESSVAYDLTPTMDDLRVMLDPTRPRYPQDLSGFEEFQVDEVVLLDPYETPI